MAANKIAAMLHRNTNKITLVLVYAFLEWTLIFLLLLNSLFSYLIIKFAEFFGLNPPCPWCSRVDHLFEQGKNMNKNYHRDLLCEAHAREVSRLGYCENHRKLVESLDTCEDCSSSGPSSLKGVGPFPWMKGLKVIESAVKCSCCGVVLERSRFCSPYIVIKPPWDALETNGNLAITEVGDGDDHTGKSDNSDEKRSDSAFYRNEDEDQLVEDGSVCVPLLSDQSEKEDFVLEKDGEFILFENLEGMMKDQSIQVCFSEEESPKILPQHLEFFIDCSGHGLVPIELIDSTTDEEPSRYQVMDEMQDDNGHKETPELVREENAVATGNMAREMEERAVPCEHKGEEDENSLMLYAKKCHSERKTCEPKDKLEILDSEEDQGRDSAAKVCHPEIVSEKFSRRQINETETVVSIGVEIPELEPTNEIQSHEGLASFACGKEDSSTISTNFIEAEGHGSKQDQEQTIDLRTSSVDLNENVVNNQWMFCLDANETGEEKAPETPSSMDSLHHLHTKLLLEKKDLGSEESLDGSIICELEGGDLVSTIEHLKSALKCERKALHALYTELEEERSASAVAANQTMAMINRLQEEKAAMQMEALHYQRMMEEQSEYDQETLELLNKLMVKREKEKQDLEKELDVYKKRVLGFEAKEKMRMLKKSTDSSARSIFSSTSCSNSEDSDGLSIDLNQEAKEDESFYGHQECANAHNTPADEVLNFEESLAGFEVEKLAILEQLKVLEEKIIKLDCDEAQQFEDVRTMKDLNEENGHLSSEADGHAIGYSTEMDGKGKNHPERRILNAKRRLLPLFDAICDERGYPILNGHENGLDPNGVHDSYVTEFHLQSKRVAVEEELNYLHERLQALEADREFLKHCMNSLKKGDKGMDLLQEILQHLRNLRSVDLRTRNLSDVRLL